MTKKTTNISASGKPKLPTSNGVKIAVIDYNAGNIASVTNALERFGIPYTVTRDVKEILSADKVIFPGQGRAKPAMEFLRESGLADVIRNVKQPFLGICLGMQLLFESSEEDETECLGIIPGTVRKFRGDMKIPQIGWNTITAVKYDPLFRDVPDTLFAYFANSYYAELAKPYTVAVSSYGNTPFTAVIRKDNFYGTQFHPEKSGLLGVQILKNFCELGTDISKRLLVAPAIDIIGGKCVRLLQGEYDKQTTYGDDPVAMAKSFVNAGAKYLHVVDLDGARKGVPENAGVITRLIKEVAVPVEVGGGIRNIEDAKLYLDSGALRIVVSTSALTNLEIVRELIAEYGPARVVVSVDARNGLVATEGWKKTTAETTESLLAKLTEAGVTTVIYTSITSDGTLKGPDYEGIGKILKMPFRVMVAGGITSINDLKKLRDMGAYGAIVGKAIYEKTISIAEAVAAILSPYISKVQPKPARTVTKRVIACMDIANGRVVKGTHFKDLKDAGDPVELGRQYSDDGIDELVFLDINATVENRKTLYELAGRIAKNINIPFTVGGGVRSISDIKNLLNAGADKVSIGSAAITNPDLINEASQAFGSQCIVISVDPKKNSVGMWEIFIRGGRDATGVDAIQFCKDMERRGAGELLVNSLDKDGTKSGYDLALLKAISQSVSIPVIASSGAGTREHFAEALLGGESDAVLAASLFHSGAINIAELKKYLSERGILVRI